MEIATPPHPELFILLAMRRLASRGASPDVGRNYEELGKIISKIVVQKMPEFRLISLVKISEKNYYLIAILRIKISLFCSFVLIAQVNVYNIPA